MSGEVAGAPALGITWLRVLAVGLTSCSAAVGVWGWPASGSQAPDAPIAAASNTGCLPTGPGRGEFPFPVGPASIMVPEGAISATACRYHGLNPVDQYGQLEGSGTLNGSQLLQLTADLNAAGFDMPLGPMNCPYDDGQSDVVAFEYQHRPTVYVVVELLGCVIASNGAVRSMLGGAPENPGAHALVILASVAGPPSGPGG